MAGEQDILRIKKISKKFPGVQALKDVSMEVRAGEVHGLVGENGAGKSTLIKMVMGYYSIDEGTILMKSDGEWHKPRTIYEAKKLGLYANYQNVNIADTLSVAENYFLGRTPMKFGMVDWRTINEKSKEYLKQFGLDINPRAKIQNLPLATQEMIMISKTALEENLKLAIFDEPTALLENEKVEILFDYIKELKEKGIGVLYISHHLEEIQRICDRITILKDGLFVATKDVKDVTKESMISMMVGRKLDDIYNIKHVKPGKEVLKVKNLSSQDYSDVSFSLRAGEILGLFGLVGAGRTEVMRGIYGADKIDNGEVYIHNKRRKRLNTRVALQNGLGIIPENRQTQGLALDLSVKVNINASSYDLISKAGIINVKKEKDRAKDYVKKINIRTPSIEQKVLNLSGGNQQKVVVSKLLCRDLDILIFDEPTAGIDVGAKQEIYKLIETLAQQGKAIILVSSYLPELIGVSDRIIVMSKGKVVSEVGRDEIEKFTDTHLLNLASTYN